MYKYPITIELLSETIFGNGQSKNGIVNTEILLDENGFPYYLGKTFKGCLKKSINTILKPYYKSKAGFEENVNKLFGEKQNEGKLKFTNFYLDNKIVDVFNKHKCLKDINDLILSSLTDIRFNIKMGENGVSESKSLRASRVLKKGLVFNGFICCSEELNEFEFMILDKGLKSLKNLGISKSRGKGLVAIKIGQKIQLNSKDYEYVKDNFDYIMYEMDLKQPVKIGDSQSQYDYEQTKSYISGSIVRGAIINKYLKSKGSEVYNINEDENFNILLKKVYFYDCYPVYESKNKKYYSFPTPNMFRMTKDIAKEDRDSYKKSCEFLTVFDNKKLNDEPTVIKLKKGEFSYYKDKILYQFNIRKDYRFHHSQENKKENIFRYESISKGQKFYGLIDMSQIDYNLKKQIYSFLNKEEIFYLGGARTSGYGETEITHIKAIKNFKGLQEELEYIKCDKIKDKFNIYFLSDSILRDENHQIVSLFSSKYLNENLKADIIENNMESEINPVILTGYNREWGSFIPHVYGVEKGSVIRATLNKSIDKNIINEFVKTQHGDRKQDGLGRVIINPEFLDPNEIKYLGTIKTGYKRESSNCELNNELITFIEECKNRVIIDKCIKANIINEFLKHTNNKTNLSNSKINNIISSIDRCLRYEENPMDEFKNEIERLSKITQNKQRNKDNYEILNRNLISGKTLKQLKSFNKEQIEDFARNILFDGLKAKQFEKEEIIKEIINNDLEDKFKSERILLNTIRDIFYYSIKSKESECVE
ncbi:RAMP superfamily CRISPR-associated protein [Clostridium frigidicarnis]|uniref:CRISPR-associated protein Csx10 n=1 Tax=Clostridium frigidicarnis TaxID=84698 RepID=A0A1I0V648_9CLOT|nr:RAMP superfamily CRISPR-associated protein [Clostridium frigidicarnis]SFA71811.1 CRISPR-associated protein Csx10 [Clostridium frigidicarnis]